ncbi:MarR family winged helix-turn-helix transcriptional regulator [Leuconostoc mesenteroides]
MDIKNMNFAMLISKIYRFKQINLDNRLKQYNISSGLRPYLFNIQSNLGITQSELNKILGNDRAMTARSIAKLKQLNLITQIPDKKNKHIQHLSLNSNAEKIMDEINVEVDAMLSDMTAGISKKELLIMHDCLEKILLNLVVMNTQKKDK